MPQINPEARDAIQPELGPGEEIIWAGKPSSRVTFHKDDLFAIPVSLIIGGFSIVWTLGASGFLNKGESSGSWPFGLLFGLPFVLYSQYLIWGRFLCAAWFKKRTSYAVTNRRVVVAQKVWRNLVASAYIDTLQALMKEERSDGFGTLRFANADAQKSKRYELGSLGGLSIGSYPTFVDIEDVTTVYCLIFDLREKAHTPKATY